MVFRRHTQEVLHPNLRPVVDQVRDGPMVFVDFFLSSRAMRLLHRLPDLLVGGVLVAVDELVLLLLHAIFVELLLLVVRVYHHEAGTHVGVLDGVDACFVFDVLLRLVLLEVVALLHRCCHFLLTVLEVEVV